MEAANVEDDSARGTERDDAELVPRETDESGPKTDPGLAKPSDVDPADAHFVAHARRYPLLQIHRALYLTFMAAEAAYYPFVGIYCLSVGLTLPETGFILALSPLCSTVATPLWGLLADRGHRRAVLVGCLGVSTALRLFIPALPRGFWPLAATVTVVELIAAPVLPVLDASTFALLRAVSASGTQGHSYGAVRAFGALGWGAMAPVVGAVMDTTGSTAGMFVILGVGILPALVLAMWLPLEQRKADGDSARSALRRLCAPEALLFFAAAFVSGCVGAGAIGAFLFPWLRALGASNLLLGLSLSFTCASEIPFFFAAGPAIRRLGFFPALLLCMLAFVARVALYALLTDPWWTLPIELLHGVTYALNWAASTEYVSVLLPPELSSSGQSLLATVQWGAGAAAGSAAAGMAVEMWGFQAMFRAAGGLACVGAVCVALQWSLFARRQAAAAADAAIPSCPSPPGRAAAGSLQVGVAGAREPPDPPDTPLAREETVADEEAAPLVIQALDQQ